MLQWLPGTRALLRLQNVYGQSAEGSRPGARKDWRGGRGEWQKPGTGRGSHALLRPAAFLFPTVFDSASIFNIFFLVLSVFLIFVIFWVKNYIYFHFLFYWYKCLRLWFFSNLWFKCILWILICSVFGKFCNFILYFFLLKSSLIEGFFDFRVFSLWPCSRMSFCGCSTCAWQEDGSSVMRV